jgi:hypothetical protein
VHNVVSGPFLPVFRRSVKLALQRITDHGLFGILVSGLNKRKAPTMNRVKSIITNSLLTLILVLSILASVLVINNNQAAAANQPASVETNQTVYLQLTDAPPLRDITQQQFAPLK